MRLPKAVAAVTFAGALVVVAGCDSSTPSANATTTAAATATPSHEASPTPTVTQTDGVDEFDATVAPEPPAGLDGPPSEEAAGQAASYFHELAPYAFATGDVEAWKAMSADSCKFCAAIAKQVEEEAAAGKRREGGRVDVLDVQAYHHKGEQYAALVTIRENESRVIAPDGSVDGEVDYKQDVQLEMLLTWNGTSWVVDGVDVKYANKL